ncbi:MAG TPA: hypothetical protein VEH06_00055 [Candidatus Bathyarchaeia archaeon]|nr:hypothetical protein [Candidatus Bathyarchaeia archaeon]
MIDKILKLGYNYGFTAAKTKSLEPDRTGDCSFDPADLKKKTICEAGWKKGYDVGIKRND